MQLLNDYNFQLTNIFGTKIYNYVLCKKVLRQFFFLVPKLMKNFGIFSSFNSTFHHYISIVHFEVKFITFSKVSMTL